MSQPMTNDHGYTAEPAERIWTIPNLISVARLLGVPVFLWLVLGVRTTAGDWWAVGLLIASGFSDWLDGKIARALNQQSKLGQLLDPAADRLYIAATIVALAVRAIIPWWLVAVLAVRELLMAVVLAMLRRQGWPGATGELHREVSHALPAVRVSAALSGVACCRLRRDCQSGRLELCYLGKCPVLVLGHAVRSAGQKAASRNRSSDGIGSSWNSHHGRQGGSAAVKPVMVP